MINKRYQLRFTLFMAGLSAVLMTGLGWWVTRVANEATTVAKSFARGTVCPPTPEQAAAQAAAAAANAPVAEPEVPPNVQVDVGELKLEPEPAAGSGSEAGSGSGTAAGAGHERKVVMDEPTAEIHEEPKRPEPPPMSAEEKAKMMAAHDACERGIQDKIERIDRGNRNITLVLVLAGVLLTFGLAVFGIKMTHKVAGPLHKVTLYLGKMRDGRYDKVYDLRKGDQLVEFYEHFKHAHAGVVTMEKADVARIKAALDAATADGVLERSPEAKAAATALRAVLERKEASYV